MPLILSLFPGLGLLDKAFEEAGFCVVRGPDIVWGGDVHNFHPTPDVFAGVIGGPPCKRFSALANINRAQYGEESLAPDLIPEFERCVSEARPDWFLMENVTGAPEPAIDGFHTNSEVVNNRWCGGVQNRVRRFSFGTRDGRKLEIKTDALEPTEFAPAVTGNNGGRRAVAVRDTNGRIRGNQGDADHHRLARRSIEEMCELQGLPKDFLAKCPLTVSGKREAIGNGVPLPMGRRVAAAVTAATT